jgi:hypothetical protein
MTFFLLVIAQFPKVGLVVWGGNGFLRKADCHGEEMVALGTKWCPKKIFMPQGENVNGLFLKSFM